VQAVAVAQVLLAVDRNKVFDPNLASKRPIAIFNEIENGSIGGLTAKEPTSSAMWASYRAQHRIFIRDWICSCAHVRRPLRSLVVCCHR
jgi:hypothetical protein